MNRLTTVSSGTHRSEFTYNGLSRRVKIVEKDNGAITSTKQFVWIPGDTQPSEERDGTNAVTKRYYGQGMQIGTTNYYYTRDHLGSVRELTDSSGAMQTRYDYDPYGRRTRLSGTLDADFGFTGHYYHQPTGLNLALNRAYDADLGRWVSRDPLPRAEMSQGPNLNTYVFNNPINYLDFDGRQTGRAALTRQETIDILYDGDEDRYNKDIRDGNATLKAAQDLTVDCMLSTVPMPKPTGNRLKDYLIDKVLGELIGDFIKGFLPSYNGPPEPNQPTPGPHPTPYPR